MSDLWGRRDQFLAGGLSSDSMFITWPNLAGFGLGLLIQQVGMQYRQPIRRIFELGPGVIPNGLDANGNPIFGSPPASAGNCDGPTPDSICQFRAQATYYIVGRPEGRLSLERFVGPQALTCEFYRKYGSPCGGNVVSISGKAGCSVNDPNAKTLFWDMFGLVLDDYQARMTGQEMVMQEGLGAMFTSLKVRSADAQGVPDSTCA